MKRVSETRPPRMFKRSKGSLEEGREGALCPQPGSPTQLLEGRVLRADEETALLASRDRLSWVQGLPSPLPWPVAQEALLQGLSDELN